jgi:hypothetical protein
MWHRGTEWPKHGSAILLHIARLFATITMPVARSRRLNKPFHQPLIFFQHTPSGLYRTAVNLNNYLVCWAAGRVGWLGSCIGWSNVLLIKDTYSCFRNRMLSLYRWSDQTGLRPISVSPPQRGVSIAALNWDAKPLNRWPDQTGLRPRPASHPLNEV